MKLNGPTLNDVTGGPEAQNLAQIKMSNFDPSMYVRRSMIMRWTLTRNNTVNPEYFRNVGIGSVLKNDANLKINSWGQFHQHSTHSFYVRKLRAQLFCAYVLGLYFTGARLLAQKLCVERW